MTTILLVRHGETDWNANRRWQGQADEPLNDRGREQARALAAALAQGEIDAVYASDLSRARETAEILGERLDLPIRLDARLREVDVGTWSGLTMAEIEQRFPEEIERWRTGDRSHSFGGGETYRLMGERVVAALAEIAARHPEGRVLVVLHGGPIRALLAHAAGITYEEQRHRRAHLENCDLVQIAVRDGSFTGVD